MKTETYNKSYAGDKWWVDQCGWGRRFDTEKAADDYIKTMTHLDLTGELPYASVVHTTARDAVQVPLDNHLALVLD